MRKQRGQGGEEGEEEGEEEEKGDTLICKLSFRRGECSEMVAYQ